MEKDYYAIFEKIGSEIQDSITEQVNTSQSKLKLDGADFEAIVYKQLVKNGIDESCIFHSSKKFPDFIITDPETQVQFGLEVKKTDSKRWTIQGGSIYESLRNKIEETYVLMLKLGNSPETRLRKYHECLCDLKVTHNPRFELDLDTPVGEDYLTRNNAQDLLDFSEGPELNRRIRELLRTDKNTWYQDEQIKSYSDLSIDEKDDFFVDGVVLFPEVVGTDYSKFAPWMTYKCLVWCSNVRDIFSAGGKGSYEDIVISAVMRRIILKASTIKERIANMTPGELEHYWNISSDLTLDQRVDSWLSILRSKFKLSQKIIDENTNLLSVNVNKEVILDKYMCYLKSAMFPTDNE